MLFDFTGSVPLAENDFNSRDLCGLIYQFSLILYVGTGTDVEIITVHYHFEIETEYVNRCIKAISLHTRKSGIKINYNNIAIPLVTYNCFGSYILNYNDLRVMLVMMIISWGKMYLYKILVKNDCKLKKKRIILIHFMIFYRE